MSGAFARDELQPASPPVRPLELIATVASSLDEAGIRYCHWKSNAAIDRSATGENDLDLLVRRADVRAFTELLSRHGFVRASRPGASIPGIESFFGHDTATGRLVHVHAHYQLVLGDDRTKNYRLPIEDAYLESAARSGLFALPSVEFEYVVFVIRMTLKYCTWDEIAWRGARGRRAGPSRTETDELSYLAARVDGVRASSVVEQHLPFVGADLFAECVAALEPDASLRGRIRAGRRLEEHLQPHARYSRNADRARRVAGRVALAAERRVGARRPSRLAGGGAIVGVTGGDGAGKSTALAALRDWLGPELDVALVHLGKPRWSATTFVTRAGLKAVAAGANALARSVRATPTRRLATAVETYRPLLWLVCTARDRQRAYRGARRHAARGGLVLCDRYPHPRLRSMEAPLIASRTAHGPDNRLVRALIALEERYHRSIAPPDLLVVLRLDPEVAVRRKTEERPETVRARGAEVWNIDWRGSRAHVVDASQPEDAVARELRALVWSVLA